MRMGEHIPIPDMRTHVHVHCDQWKQLKLRCTSIGPAWHPKLIRSSSHGHTENHECKAGDELTLACQRCFISASTLALSMSWS